MARAQLTGEWLRVAVVVASEPPHLIERLDVSFVPPFQVPASESAASQAEIVDELGDLVDRLAEAKCFSGAVLLADGEEVRLERAWGFANEASRLPNRPQTRFNVDSIGEMFTAVAIAQLADSGLLDFDDLVAEHLPDLPPALAERITIHQLLTHTSGLGHFQNDRFRDRRETLRSVSDFVALFADEPLVFEPGERYGYSTAGYVVLGAIVERVSGEEYFDYVREQIYRPAGMCESDYHQYDDADVAIGYTQHALDGPLAPGAPLRPNLEFLPPTGGPAGGGFSTVGDLHRFARALLAHELVSKELTDLMLAGKVQWSALASYGYGFEEHRFGGSVGHGGGGPGASTDFAIYPELGYTVVVLSNYDPPHARRVADFARRLIAAEGQADEGERGLGPWRSGWFRRQRALDGAAQSAAAAAMSRQLGAPVSLELSSRPRGAQKPVIRCRVTDGPSTAPASVIVKHLPQPAHGPSLALFNEWAGSAFLSQLELDPPVSPAFYGADARGGVVVVEDLGEGDSLAEVLLGSDPGRAESALLALASSLGRMHAASIRRVSEYERLRAPLGPPGGGPVIDASALATRFERGLASTGLSLGDAEDDVERAVGRITEPGPFLAYVHGDPCPDNNRLVDGRAVLIDFAAGRLGHALLDGVYGRVPFPTCWCARRLAAHVPALMESAYRSELVHGCHAAEDDASFAIEAATACAYWLIETTAVALSATPFRDFTWGVSTVGQRLALRIALFTELAEETGNYRALADVLRRLVDALGVADEQMPLYPAFGGPPPSAS